MAENEAIGPLIAVVGCDGSGKSRLSADLLTHVQKTRPAETGYLGLGSGEQGRQIGRWPLIGPMLQRYLEDVADRLRDPAAPIPGVIAAGYALRKSKKRYRQFQSLLEKRRRGVVVVTDRYPQVERPGVHDGPILAGTARSEKLARIQDEERALYQEMAAYVPTLVIHLKVDVDTAMARKPDHDRKLIALKIASLPQITFNGARIVVLDATMDYDEELSKAKAAVDAALAA
ncbi:MAG: hypothetical protein AAB227_11015 [Pseudomonadota bacterium]